MAFEEIANGRAVNGKAKLLSIALLKIDSSDQG